MPDSQVVLPIRRMGTSNMLIGDGPCGGIEKKAANTLTTKVQQLILFGIN